MQIFLKIPRHNFVRYELKTGHMDYLVILQNRENCIDILDSPRSNILKFYSTHTSIIHARPTSITFSRIIHRKKFTKI